MRLQGHIAVTLWAIVLAVTAAGQARAANPAIQAAETSVRLGLTAGYGHYEENISPQDTETGALLGFSSSVSALSPSGLSGYGVPDLYGDVEYDFSAGFLNYNGYLQNGANTPYQTNDNAYYNTAIIRLGVGAPIGGAAEAIPYFAGGYQNWYRNLGSTAGYSEYYQAGLIGGGLRLDIASSPLLVLSARAEGFAVIGGSVSVPSQNFSGSFGTSAEERVSLDADYRLNDSWHAFAGLGLTHYGYTGSKAGADGLFEPLSTTLQLNTIFGISYGF